MSSFKDFLTSQHRHQRHGQQREHNPHHSDQPHHSDKAQRQADFYARVPPYKGCKGRYAGQSHRERR